MGVFNNVMNFLLWLGQEGNSVEFPFPGGKGWVVRIKGGSAPSVSIESSFYKVEGAPPYGAPKIVGHMVDFGGYQAAGVVELGFDETTGQPKIVNRRRLVEGDELAEGKVVIGVTDAWPDRVDEPTAVVLSMAELTAWKELDAEDWVELADSARDGVELMAIRAVRRHTAS